MEKVDSIDDIKKVIALNENTIKSLEEVKKFSEIGPQAIRYIDEHIEWLRKNNFDLQTKIDMFERD